MRQRKLTQIPFIMYRRTFLKTSTAAVAGIMMPNFIHAASTLGKASANDKINVALIGCRSMGWGDYAEFFKFPQANPMALCDVDGKVLSSRGAELEKITGRKPKLYTDYRQLLDNKDIDAVLIGTPDHWHCLMTTDACAAGKDVYVEKPLANTIAECDAMVQAAEHYGRVVQVGQQQRSGTIWHEMKKYIDSGKLGKIAKVKVWANFRYASIPQVTADSTAPDGVDYNMWLGPAPERAFNQKRFHGLWRMFWDYGGGLVTDWGVHLLDMALWGMNTTTMPRRVMASGGNFACPGDMAETFNTMSVTWVYDDFIIEWDNTTAAEIGPYGKNYGLVFCGSNGSLVANREGWHVIAAPKSGLEETSFKPDEKDRTNHVENFLSCINSRNMNTACTIQNGSFCAKFAHLGNIAARTNEVLTYDDAKQTFHNKAADKLIKPEYRKPWKFPRI